MPAPPNEMSDIWMPVLPSGRYERTVDPLQAGSGCADSFGASDIRNRYVLFRHAACHATAAAPPAATVAAPFKTLRRVSLRESSSLPSMRTSQPQRSG